MKRILFMMVFLLMTVVGVRADEPTTQPMPTLWIIGDSTVHNSGNEMVGWGDVIASRFDTTKIRIINRARGGRSSRTFLTEGLWEQTAKEIQKGDFVLMQFGHNDGGPIEGDPKGRRSLPGTGDETKDQKKQNSEEVESVHTFGWYMRTFIRASVEKGATPIVLSPVPRDNWKDGKVNRTTDNFTKWDKELAAEEKISFIDLNDISATKFEALGQEAVKKFFTTSERDRTHTVKAGAELNADSVVDGIKALEDSALKAYLK